MGGSAKESGCGRNTKIRPIPRFGDFRSIMRTVKKGTRIY